MPGDTSKLTRGKLTNFYFPVIKPLDADLNNRKQTGLTEFHHHLTFSLFLSIDESIGNSNREKAQYHY